MEKIKIPAVIRPALQSELFGKLDTPFSNVVFFIKNRNSGQFEGPYNFYDGYDQDEFIHRFIFRELYVIVTECEGYNFLLNLRIADKYDMLEGLYLRENYLYYVKESDDIVSGPFYLSLESDPHEIAALVNKKAIYVIDNNQDFTPYQLKKSA